jgi:hypothetical protein
VIVGHVFRVLLPPAPLARFALRIRRSGYLIASSRGDSRFAVYRCEDENEYVKAFKASRGDGIDAVDESDGIEVTPCDLGECLPGLSARGPRRQGRSRQDELQARLVGD